MAHFHQVLFSCWWRPVSTEPLCMCMYSVLRVCPCNPVTKPLVAGDLRYFLGTFVRRGHAVICQPDHMPEFRPSSVNIHRYYRAGEREKPWRDLLRDVSIQLVGHRSILVDSDRQTAFRKRGQSRMSICWIIIVCTKYSVVVSSPNPLRFPLQVQRAS